jgi:hypothetical protein
LRERGRKKEKERESIETRKRKKSLGLKILRSTLEYTKAKLNTITEQSELMQNQFSSKGRNVKSWRK